MVIKRKELWDKLDKIGYMGTIEVMHFRFTKKNQINASKGFSLARTLIMNFTILFDRVLNLKYVLLKL